MRRKCPVLYVVGGCGWCRGDVMRGYKGGPRLQKCLVCHRLSVLVGIKLEVRPW